MKNICLESISDHEFEKLERIFKINQYLHEEWNPVGFTVPKETLNENTKMESFGKCVPVAQELIKIHKQETKRQNKHREEFGEVYQPSILDVYCHNQPNRKIK